MSEETVIFSMFAILIAGGVVVIVSGMRHHGKVLEMAHRERLAMIERGLAPPPELSSSPYGPLAQQRRAARSTRMLSGGIMTVGLGLGVAMVLGFASREP